MVDDAGTAQGPAAALIKLSDMHALFPAPQSYVHSGRATPLLAFRAQCGANRTKELHLNVCLDDVEHALRFVLDADALNRRVLVLLQKNDSVEEVAHRAAVFLGAYLQLVHDAVFRGWFLERLHMELTTNAGSELALEFISCLTAQHSFTFRRIGWSAGALARSNPCLWSVCVPFAKWRQSSLWMNVSLYSLICINPHISA